ncbi:MAG: VWA domain-containing protein [Myxococcales bacterium]|nr:VWA domain-containing protein [Myxococcales bacterium]
MGLTLDAQVARFPELGGSERDVFVLVSVSGAPPALGLQTTPGFASPLAGAPGRPPVVLALALDASSSMRGNRFALALQAARNVVGSLGPSDRFAVVTFDRGARLVLPPTSLDAEGARVVHAALDRLGTGIGTNLGSGWREAAEAVLRVMVPGATRRVLLLTDGYPSRGETGPEVLQSRVAEGASRGVETSVIGLGDGIDEKLCALLAGAGGGRFHYVRDELAIGELVAAEVEGGKSVVANDVRLSVSLGMAVERAELMHRYPCQPDGAEGRQMVVRVGAVTRDSARRVLLQIRRFGRDPEAHLGEVSAQGVGVDSGPQVSFSGVTTRSGYALGASRGGAAGALEALAVPLRLAGLGGDGERRAVAREILFLRTAAEIRGAWDALDASDRPAVERRLERARALRKALIESGLVDPEGLAGLPDVDAVHRAMVAPAPEAREARRRLASWAHNTQVSFGGVVLPKRS